MGRHDTAPLGPRFVRVLTATGLSNLADGVSKVAVPLVAVRFTDSPLALGGLGVAMTLPWLLLSLPAGALADRLDRRRIMLAANGARALVAGLLAVVLAAGVESIALLYAAALLAGIAEVLYDTSSQSILPQVVRRPDLPRANARLYGVEMVANQFAGPPLGGLLVGVAAALALGAPAALWALAVVALASVRGEFRVARTGPTTTVRADIGEGLRYLARHRVLRTLAAMTGLANLASSMVFAVFVLFAVGPSSPLGLTDATYGILLATTSVGAVLGSLLATRVAATFGRAASLAFGVVTFTVMAGTPAVTTNPWVVGAVFLVSGLGVMVWNVIAVSLRQQVTPDALLGRTNACYRLLAWGLQPVGAFLGGVIGQAFGLRPVFVVAASLSALTALGLLVVTNRAIADAEAAAEAGAQAEPGAAAAVGSDAEATVASREPGEG
ncbi:MFS transporter [Xylanimonas protaetiae]|uniref:MFS transporter n=1 Tax=Xylanimonas protaetiae TaxID=2509457 RepID=A0A4P6F2T0_9MICO|nr:MFS transporter [Xylanimonas protaetiae]QAY69872.1 MFS transporter [Xylanimonas protaetiae]